MRIRVVSVDHVLENILVDNIHAFFLQLDIAAARSALGRSVKEDLQLRVGEHYGADISAVHNHVLGMSHVTLGIQQKSPNLGNRGNSGRHHRNLGCTNQTGDILAVKQDDLLSFIIERELDGNIGQQRRYRFSVIGGNALAVRVKPDRTIQRACINVDKSEFFGSHFCDSGFSRAGGTIDSDCDRHSMTPF